MPGESHGQRSLADYGPQGLKESDVTAATEHAHTHIQRESVFYGTLPGSAVGQPLKAPRLQSVIRVSEKHLELETGA